MNIRRFVTWRCCAAILMAAIFIYVASQYCGWAEREARQAFLALIPKNLSSLAAINAGTCDCARYVRHARAIKFHSTSASKDSTCSDEATARGPHQRVVSFSLYGPLTEWYEAGIRRNAEGIARFYPDWNMRVYESLDTGDHQQRHALCDIWCRYPQLDFCPIGRLPRGSLSEFENGDIAECNGMVWRSMVLGDPTVDRFIIRDLDSRITAREVAAVSSWIKSNRSWHFMHDHPEHNTPVMGGMWGGLNRNLELNQRIREALITDGIASHSKGDDQVLLTKHLFGVATADGGDFLDHSSYLCNSYMASTPFPTRRLPSNDFVGSIDGDSENTTRTMKRCPAECRPAEHLDWIYC